MTPFPSRVADRQRLGMKMFLHCESPFAASAKLATSGATNGDRPARRGASRLKDDKGALRMNVGMRVRGGVLAALVLVAMPVAAAVTATLMPLTDLAQHPSAYALEQRGRLQ